ncbi:MAG: hypothetical protein K0V04_26630, partial [Deltaproteobacteria bacterium]|nr:hypothetical protein [Deltaproteobacteria bacterium]
ELRWPGDSPFATAYDVVIAPDRSIIVAGMRVVEGSGTVAVVLGLAEDLSVTWAVEMEGASPDDNVAARSLSIAEDGSIWAAGTSARNEAGEFIDQPWISRLDPTGGLQWSQVVDGPPSGERYRDVVALPGGDAIAVGWTELPDGTVRRLVRRHAASDGAEVWEDVEAMEQPESVALSGTLSEEGDVVVAGWIRGAQQYRDLRLQRYDVDGLEVDTTLFSEPITSYFPRDVVMDPSQDAIACGSVVRASAENAMIGRFALASATPVSWLQRIEAMGQGATGCEGLAVDPLGRVAIAGYAFNSDSSFDPLVGRLDVDGEILWSNRIVPTQGFFGDVAEGIAVEASGDLIVVGHAQDQDGAQLWVGRVRG